MVLGTKEMPAYCLGHIAARRVIEASGGELVGRFVKLPAYGGKPALRFRIHLAS